MEQSNFFSDYWIFLIFAKAPTTAVHEGLYASDFFIRFHLNCLLVTFLYVKKKRIGKMGAFGCSTQRFDDLGLHPKLLTINKSNKLGPGEYNLNYMECAYKKNVSSWESKLKSEEFSKNLGFKFPLVLEQRRFERTLGGPGTYDLIDYKEVKGKKNNGFGCEARLKTYLKSDHPPPGTYTIKKVSHRFTTRPTFEFDITERFKNREAAFAKAPNRYDLPHASILDHVVSKRGPYDTFTGPRDASTIKNHFAPPLFAPPDKWYPVPSAMDHLLHHKSKSQTGKFLLAKRFPKRVHIKPTKNGFTSFCKDANYPSPAAYSRQLTIGCKPNAKPFNSSNVHAREPTNWAIRPGADRYIVAYPKCARRVAKPSWMFMTKYERSIFVTKLDDYLA